MPTFLSLKFDSQLMFAAHISTVKRMAERCACLSAIARKSYGCHHSKLRVAYQSCVRPAAVFFTHAVAAVRERPEVE